MQTNNRQIAGHPAGLYILFFTEMWERFSFYGMKALLLLYLIKYHLFTDEHGYNLLGAYGGLVYAIPVIGGLLADRYLGMRKAVIFGAILLVLGHLGMAYEGHAATLVNGLVVRDENSMQVFYFSLSLIILGVGFLKPNISTIVGRLYPDNDPRRDSGFTIFYAGINLGGALAPLICAYLGETYGWKYGFGLAGIGMLAGLFVFLAGQRFLQGQGEPSDPERLAKRTAGIKTEYWIYLISILGLLPIWWLIQTHSLSVSFAAILPSASPVIWFLHSITAILTIGITWFMIKHCTKVEREQMIVLIVFIIAGLLFFALYEQTYGSWLTFSDRLMNRKTLGINWNAGQLTFLGSLFVILFTPFFAWLWPALDKRKLNPNKPIKLSFAILLAGLSFFVLIAGIKMPATNGLVSVWFLVGAYFVLEIGEMMLSPIGLSAITQLSVPRVVSVMMGAWFLGTSYSEIVASELNKLSSVDTSAGVITDIVLGFSKYEYLFMLSAKIGIGASLVFFVLSPVLKKFMNGVK